MSRRGTVRVDGQRVGEIVATETGTRFTYDAAWVAMPRARPVSLTMPVRSEPYEAKGLLTFFENLRPEGWLLEIAMAKLKIGKDDAFGLLLATCADCVGAVEVIAS